MGINQYLKSMDNLHTPSNSFTALLGLPSNQALHLLHDHSSPSTSAQYEPIPNAQSPKRKGSVKKPKVAKKSKCEDESSGGVEKLPYVHVRARRGQATDSHSLAERARREKINARMKLLQEIVPGCSRISGTALVLDQIINHVLSLQRQVEFLSMRLAAVNPRVDFSGLDSFLYAEYGRITAASALPGWSLDSYPHQNHVCHADSLRQHGQSLSATFWGKDSTNSSLSFIPTTASLSSPVPCSSPTASSHTYHGTQTN